MEWEWNDKTKAGTVLSGFGFLVDVVSLASRRPVGLLLGTGMAGAGGYLVYDGVSGEEGDGGHRHRTEKANLPSLILFFTTIQPR